MVTLQGTKFLVFDGRFEEFVVDYDETIDKVVKHVTIGIVIFLALAHDWPIHQSDVKCVFLQGDL